jgi:Rieske 2Fe-2S family protein
MLPTAAYLDPAVFAWEQRQFFSGGWTCVGLSAQLAGPGAQRAEAAAGGSVLLTRGEDNVLRAFANTCRHRGHELLACGTATRRGSVVCPYHSWAYSLSGELRAAAGFTGFPSFDASQWGLAALPVIEWHGLIFVNSSATAEPLARSLDSLESVIAPYEPERLVIGRQCHYEIAANWKVVCENYSECYHCPVIHPQLCKVSPPKSGHGIAPAGGWTCAWMDLRDGMDTMSMDGRSDSVPLRGLAGVQLRTVAYIVLFPNVLLSLHPDYVMTHRLTPLTAGTTAVECTWAFAPEAGQAAGFSPDYAVDFWDLTNRQDWLACESVQRGLSSEHASPGPLSQEEEYVYQFVTMIARGYRGQPLWEPAASAAAAAPASQAE